MSRTITTIKSMRTLIPSERRHTIGFFVYNKAGQDSYQTEKIKLLTANPWLTGIIENE